jgi:hypothetical protein
MMKGPRAQPLLPPLEPWRSHPLLRSIPTPPQSKVEAPHSPEGAPPQEQDLAQTTVAALAPPSPSRKISAPLLSKALPQLTEWG